jgi:hypothetical protein
VWSALVTAMLAWSTPPSADAIPLAWDAPAECPDEAAVRARVAGLLAASNVETIAPGFVISARVRTTAEGYRLDLDLGEGQRQIEARECGELADAAALIVAIAIDPFALASAEPALEPAPPEPDPPPRTPSRAIDPFEPPLVSTAGVADRTGVRRSVPTLAMRGGAGVDVALWRPVGASFVLGFGVVGRGYRVDLLGRYAAPSHAIAPSHRAIYASTQQWSIGIAACYSATFERVRALELPLCGGAEVGAMHARGHGTAIVPRANRAPWVAVSAGPGFAWKLGRRVALWASAEAVVLITAPRFVTDRGTVVLQPNRAGFRALAGIELRFRGER